MDNNKSGLGFFCLFYKIMRAFTENELINISEMMKDKEAWGIENYFYAKDDLEKRRDYIYPVITELAKKNILLKDISEDLFDEYMIIITLLDRYK